MKQGRPATKFFRVYDTETGELVVEGTSRECSQALGVADETTRNSYHNTINGTYKGFRIEAISEDEARSDAEAIMKWDAFCEPIRKKYGIPVKRMKVEDKDNGRL